MNNYLKKNIANIFTISRIPLALLMLINGEMNSIFYILFFLCGLTDVLDGYFSRKFNSQNRFGSILDSIADLVFFGIALFLTLIQYGTKLEDISRLMLTVVFILRLLCYLIGLIKFKTLAALHTYLNKATGFAIFISIVFIPIIGINIPCILTCLVAILAVIEEICISLVSPFILSNTYTIFHAMKKIERRH